MAEGNIIEQFWAVREMDHNTAISCILHSRLGTVIQQSGKKAGFAIEQ